MPQNVFPYVEEVVAGSGVTVDNSNPSKPVVAASGGGSVSWDDVTDKPATFPVADATTETAGGVKLAAHVDPTTGTVEEVVNSLIAAGVMAGA